MDFKKFDDLTRRFTTGTARRSIVKSGAVATLGALTGAFKQDAAADGCKGKNENCDKNNDCCSKKCGDNGKCKCSKTGKRCENNGDCCNNRAECGRNGGGKKKCFVS